MKLKKAEIHFEAIKVVKWYDRKKRSIFFGLDVKIKGRWYHLKDDEPYFFDTEHEAAQRIKKIYFKQNMLV